MGASFSNTAFSRGSASHVNGGSNYAGESCADSTYGEIRAEMMDAQTPLEDVCTWGKLVPLPRPKQGQRVQISLGDLCVFVEATGEVVVWDKGASGEIVPGVEMERIDVDGYGEP